MGWRAMGSAGFQPADNGILPLSFSRYTAQRTVI